MTAKPGKNGDENNGNNSEIQREKDTKKERKGKEREG